jgi:hypothetical protein
LQGENTGTGIIKSGVEKQNITLWDVIADAIE